MHHVRNEQAPRRAPEVGLNRYIDAKGIARSRAMPVLRSGDVAQDPAVDPESRTARRTRRRAANVGDHARHFLDAGKTPDQGGRPVLRDEAPAHRVEVGIGEGGGDDVDPSGAADRGQPLQPEPGTGIGRPLSNTCQ